MGARENLQKLLVKKQQEIDDLEASLRDARIYVQAVQDSMRLLPKDRIDNNDAAKELRPGTMVAQAREAILSAGRPLALNELLQSIGRPIDKNNRLSLSGSLSGYVRKGDVFTRPAPNTFGLREMEVEIGEDELAGEELPSDFGR
jgi:hypothetical protein